MPWGSWLPARSPSVLCRLPAWKASAVLSAVGAIQTGRTHHEFNSARNLVQHACHWQDGVNVWHCVMQVSVCCCCYLMTAGSFGSNWLPFLLFSEGSEYAQLLQAAWTQLTQSFRVRESKRIQGVRNHTDTQCGLINRQLVISGSGPPSIQITTLVLKQNLTAATGIARGQIVRRHR